MVLSGCVWSTMGSAVMGNSSFDFAQDLRFASACANDRFLAATKPRRKINHEFTRMDTNFLDADFAATKTLRHEEHEFILSQSTLRTQRVFNQADIFVQIFSRSELLLKICTQLLGHLAMVHLKLSGLAKEAVSVRHGLALRNVAMNLLLTD